MNLKEIVKNYSQRGFNWFLNKIPLRYHSCRIMYFFTNTFMSFYWKKVVNSPSNPNFYKLYYDRNPEKEFSLLLDFIENRLGCRIHSFFEVGCNVGVNLMVIKKIYGADKSIGYFGCDINELAIRDVQKVDFGGESGFVVADASDLKFLRKIPDNSFDVVFTWGLVMFIPSGRLKQEVMKELLRISRGCLLLIERWEGKDHVLYTNSHILYYEDLRKYISKKSELFTIPGLNEKILFIKKEENTVDTQKKNYWKAAAILKNIAEEGIKK